VNDLFLGRLENIAKRKRVRMNRASKARMERATTDRLAVNLQRHVGNCIGRVRSRDRPGDQRRLRHSDVRLLFHQVRVPKAACGVDADDGLAWTEEAFNRKRLGRRDAESAFGTE